jgi:hypothetical protein
MNRITPLLQARLQGFLCKYYLADLNKAYSIKSSSSVQVKRITNPIETAKVIRQKEWTDSHISLFHSSTCVNWSTFHVNAGLTLEEQLKQLRDSCVSKKEIQKSTSLDFTYSISFCQ